MIIKWNPFWYELDQSVVIGVIDYFYIQKDWQAFFSGGVSKEDYEVEAEIISISHRILGPIKGILAEGLDYSFFLENGVIVKVNAEEEPGANDYKPMNIVDWNMDVELHVINETGLTSQDRIDRLTREEIEEARRERQVRYKHLLEKQ